MYPGGVPRDGRIRPSMGPPPCGYTSLGGYGSTVTCPPVAGKCRNVLSRHGTVPQMDSSVANGHLRPSILGTSRRPRLRMTSYTSRQPTKGTPYQLVRGAGSLVGSRMYCHPEARSDIAGPHTRSHVTGPGQKARTSQWPAVPAGHSAVASNRAGHLPVVAAVSPSRRS